LPTIPTTHTIVFTAATLADWTALVSYITSLNLTSAVLAGFTRQDQPGQRKMTITYTEPFTLPTQGL
jgi:hypothetical protein